jgi:hypothetical protein
MWRERGEIVQGGKDMQASIPRHREEQASMEETWRLKPHKKK